MSGQSQMEQQLIRDCRLLFGSEPRITRDFLAYLRLSGVKSAFRQRALATHPDTFAFLGGADRSSEDEFIAIRQAFENLSRYIAHREAGGRVASAASPSDRRAARSFYDRDGSVWNGDGNCRRNGFGPNARQQLYQGVIPERRLLLGHFFYYSGLVSWRSIVQALIWQRSSRPRLGELALDLGWLSDDHVRAVLDNRDVRQPFGRSAVTMALLSDAQCRHLLDRQRRMQKRIGRFFVESGRMTPAQFSQMIVRFHLHNTRARE